MITIIIIMVTRITVWLRLRTCTRTKYMYGEHRRRSLWRRVVVGVQRVTTLLNVPRTVNHAVLLQATTLFLTHPSVKERNVCSSSGHCFRVNELRQAQYKRLSPQSSSAQEKNVCYSSDRCFWVHAQRRQAAIQTQPNILGKLSVIAVIENKENVKLLCRLICHSCCEIYYIGITRGCSLPCNGSRNTQHLSLPPSPRIIAVVRL